MVGSLAALADLVERGDVLTLTTDSDVVIVPTAAAFVGAPQAAIAASSTLSVSGARMEALMVLDRTSSSDEYFARRVREADAVVVCDGSALHAASVWRDSALGEAMRHARTLICVGSVSSVLGETMIDPRGGAPGVGLGYRTGLVITTPQGADQMARTRSLLGREVTLAVLGATGVLVGEHGSWRHVTGDVVVTRGEDPAEL